MTLDRLTDSLELPPVGTKISIYKTDGAVKTAILKDGKVVETAFGGLHDSTYIVYAETREEGDPKLYNMTAVDFLDITWEANNSD